MKTAILLCAFEKNDCLPNTLTGIAKQNTSFPVQTILVDDCSPVDPEPIAREYLPDIRCVRLDNRSGGRLTRMKYFEYIDEDVDTLVFLSADVVMLQDNIVETLCNGIGPRLFTMAQVKNHYVLPNSHQNWGFFKNQMLDMWDVLPGGGKIYSGRERPDGKWYFFCAAIRKKDALALEMDKMVCCDAVLDKKLRGQQFTVRYCDELKAIHQAHQWVQHPCAVLDTCDHSREFACRDRGVTQG
jgi:glycosyltransferase involved in cell wall biosynthesis